MSFKDMLMQSNVDREAELNGVLNDIDTSIEDVKLTKMVTYHPYLFQNGSRTSWLNHGRTRWW